MEMLTVITTITVALITAVVGPIIVTWAKSKLEKRVDSDSTPMSEALEYSSLIDSQLEDIIEELECDRVWVAQFHNGGHFYPTGKSIQKFSIFYEKCSPKVSAIQTTFQNIPVSLFTKALSKVYTDSELHIVGKEDEDGNTFALDALTSQFQTKSVCLIGLKSLDNHLIGVLGISYVAEKKLEREEWIYIRQKVGAIGALLSEYLYRQNQANK
jgi:hypothetical protein